MIIIERLKKTYDGVNYILDGIDIKINKGEYVQIVGDSGTGKSTLLNIIGMLDSDYDGKVYIKGNDLSMMNEYDISKLRAESVGFIFQSYNLVHNLTAYENIILPILYSKKKYTKEFVDRVEMLMKNFHIYAYRDKPIQFLSGGEKQRVAIARALVLDPDIILADEPTGNLDKKNSDMIYSTLRKLSNEGKTVLLVTHNWYDKNGADRTLNFKEGILL